MHHCLTHGCKKPQVCKCRFMRNTSIPVIWLIGGVGSGKKTLGTGLAQRFDMTFISGGDLLRDISQSRSERAPEILKKLQEAELVDDDLIVELLENRMKTLYKSTQGFLLSFIKNTNQGDLFESYVAPVDLILYLDCTEEVMLKRASDRLASMPDLDDSPESIERRIEQFTSTIAGILEKYESKVTTIQGDADTDTIMTEAIGHVENAKASKHGNNEAVEILNNDEEESVEPT